MNHKKPGKINRMLAVLLSVLMILSTFPMSVFAADAPVVSTDITEKTLTVGAMVNFTVSTVANDAVGTTVVGTLEFSDTDAIERLEYFEVLDNKWYEFDGNFGPAEGFSLTDITSDFRVIFNKAGKYTFTITINNVETGEQVCSTTESIEVVKTNAVVTTDITEKTLVIGETTEFAFTTAANDDAGVSVVGAFTFSNPDAIEKLEYYEVADGNWYELTGDFGPAEGFPLGDVTANFRVTFKKAGDFSFTVAIKAVEDGSVLCSTTEDITVLDKFDVTVSANDGGTVKINDTDVTASEFIENDEVKISAVAAQGYQIAGVSINGVAQSITDVAAFEKTFAVTGDVAVDVQFVKVYTITVKYDSEKGSVVSDPESNGGAVVVVTGTKVALVATPGADYRVSKVVVTGKADRYFEDNTYNSANPFNEDLSADKDYTVEITFAPLVYNVTAGASVGGKVEVSESPVNIHGSSVVTIVPSEGYQIDTVTVNGADAYGSIVEDAADENKFYIQLDDISEDKTVAVTFKEITVASESDITWNSDDSIRNENNLYVFKKGTVISFETAKDAIKITYTDGTVVGDRNTTKIDIAENKDIASVSVRYDFAWHEIKLEGKNLELNLRFDEAKPTASVNAVEDANESGYYNSDVELEINVNEAGDFSGIEKIEYWVECDGEETIKETIFEAEEDEFASEAKENITIDADVNNSADVKVFVKATDKAGNESKVAELALKICSTAPGVTISFVDNRSDEATDNWYNNTRKATISIRDRADVFDKEAATKGIVFAEGSNTNYTINWSSDGDNHTAVVEFPDEGTYNWSYSYTNKADLEAAVIAEGGNEYDFRIDKTSPTGEIKAKSDAWDSESTWTELLDKLTFNLFSDKDVTVGLAGDAGSDTLSGFQKVDYYKSTEDVVISESDLINLYNENKFTSEKITVSADEQFAVYARIVDNAGNVKYIGTNGVIYDVTVSEITFDVTDLPNENSIYGTNHVKDYTVETADGNKTVTGIKVNVNVEDSNSANDFYSGIKEIRYTVTLGDITTQSGTLFAFDVADPEKKDLVNSWNGDVVIDAKKNNGAGVKLTVFVTDNAGNTNQNTVTIKEINIDTLTAMVSVSSEKANTLIDGYGWYKTSRTATITIKDRVSCFDEVAAKNAIRISAVDIDGNNLVLTEDDVKFSAWTNIDDMHSINVEFISDGIYSWSIEYTNDAGNVLAQEKISYGTSVSPKVFTIDKSAPTGEIKVNDYKWVDMLLETITFGLYSNKAAVVSASSADRFSPVTTEYYKHSGNKALSFNVLDTLYTEGKFTAELSETATEQQFTMYMRVTDNAGNYIYVSSDGFVIDATNTVLAVDIVEEPNENGIFGIANVSDYSEQGSASGIMVAITAKEAENIDESYAGIQNIRYEVKAKIDGEVKTTQSGVLYNFDYSRYEVENSNGGALIINDKNSSVSYTGNYPEKDMLCREWTGNIIVDAKANNSSVVFVIVYVTDNAGNETKQCVKLDIDITAPSIDVAYNNNTCINGKYFDASRTATVTFTERADHFNKDIATQGIVITAKDSSGKDVSNAYSIVWDENCTSADPDENTFTATITYAADANYIFNVSYTDMAGNANTAVNTGRSVAPYDFTVDTVDPEGTVFVDEYSWSELLSVLSFGLYSNKEKVNVKATAYDATSPVTIEYYKTSEETALTSAQLMNVNFVSYEEFDVSASEQFTVYVKITDMAGHITFVNSDGYIIERELCEIALDATDSPNEDGIYGIADFGTYTVDGEEIYGINVNVDVNEVILEKDDHNVYSGIADIRYEVKANIAGQDRITQSGILYNASYVRDLGTEGEKHNTNGGKLTITDVNAAEVITKNGNGTPSKEDLLTHWDGNIIIDADKNDSKDVVLTVFVTDNAGNTNNTNVATLNFDINATTPIVTISYDKNDPLNEKYFGSQRVATIEIVERYEHFNSEAATDGIDINAVTVDGKTAVENAYVISDWTSVRNEKNGDLSTHTATVVFEKDANYNFNMSYTGLSGNTAEIKFAEGSVACNEFTVDTVDPYGEIKVDDNVWTKILKFITFGFYKNGTANVEITAADATSPVEIEYYKTNDPVAIAESELDKAAFVKYEKFSVSGNEQFVIYARITDNAGNVAYINSDGHILDPDVAEIVLVPAEPNENALYNNDVNVAIKVSEVADETADLSVYPYSGIAKVEYWVVAGDGEKAVETQRDVLYSFDYTRESGENSNGGTLVITDKATGEAVTTTETGNVPRKEQLRSEWTGNITVDSKLNNNCAVYVYVGVTDNAGNYSEECQKLDIDITAPVIEVTYEDNANEGAKNGYYTSRKATVVITERVHHFDAKAATEGIVITAVNAKDEKVINAYTISSWTTEKTENPDEAKHTAVIEYVSDANYTFDISYTDKAGNAAADYTMNTFCVDKTAPTGTITAKSAEGRTETWSSIVDTLTFGFWSNTKISVSATSDDVTSPIQSVQYYMPVAEVATDSTTILKKADLDKLTTEDWKSFAAFDVTANNQFTVYLKITDNAGNYTYIATNGLIVDDQHPVEESVAPEISVTPAKPVNGIYSDDVKVAITVSDPMVGGTYSGLKEVTYKVFDRDSKTPDVPTQEGVLFKFDKAYPKQSELEKTWSGEITVSAKKNNSNNVQIVVYAVDNSLNAVDNSQKESSGYASIKIDTTAPVINVDYNNNDLDSGSYYKADRTATVTITERNFNPDDVVISITNTDGTIPAVIGWTNKAGTFNNDDATHTATVTYTADGDYVFNIEYTDLAGNKSKAVDYGTSETPTEFTVDKTIPVVNVSYDNNEALNENYYDDTRTATIVVDEHNFIANRVDVTISATDDSEPTTAPSISGWKTEGDIHTTTVYYSADARYEFDIAINDLAGNAGADYENEVFFVDKTAPSLEITGVENLSSNNGTVIPVVTYSDTNFDADNVEIRLSGANRSQVSLIGAYSDIHNGQVFTFADFENEEEIDDIYTLYAELTDKAGNSTSETLNFSVNRFGSVYTMSEDSASVNNKYIQEPGDVVITETNADALSNIKITLFKNNETIVLEEGVDYKIDVAGGNGSWYQYTYTVFKTNFADDGVYRMLIHSEDEAGNVAENTLDTKDFEINFGVDKTAPVVNVNNLESGKTYALDSMNVQMTVNDNLILTSVVVYLDGNEYQNWSGEEIETIIDEGGNFSFNISGDSTEAHNLKIVATDAAGNELVENIEDFYITTNLWVRYYNNKVLFYGSIAGVILVSGLLVFLVVWKRKKNEAK